MKQARPIGFLLAAVLTFGLTLAQQDDTCDALDMIPQQWMSSYNQAVLTFGLTLAQQDDTCNALAMIPQQWVGSYNQRDLASVANLYTEDARFFASTGEVFEGRQAIQELFRGLTDRGATRATIEIHEMEILGGTAHGIGSQRFMNDGGQAVVEGYSLLIFKQVGGEWKIHRQLVNRQVPASETGSEEASGNN